jgi:hypothetical protein
VYRAGLHWLTGGRGGGVEPMRDDIKKCLGLFQYVPYVTKKTFALCASNGRERKEIKYLEGGEEGGANVPSFWKTLLIRYNENFYFGQ